MDNKQTANTDRFWVNDLYVNDNLRHNKGTVTPLYKNDEGKYAREPFAEGDKPATYAVKLPYQDAVHHSVTAYADHISQKTENKYSAQFTAFDGKIRIDKSVPDLDEKGQQKLTDDGKKMYRKEKVEVSKEDFVKNVKEGQEWRPDKSKSAEKSDAIKQAMAKGEAVAQAEAPQAEQQAEA